MTVFLKAPATTVEVPRRSPFLAFDIGCQHPDVGEHRPDHNGDPACPECLAEWGLLDDDAEYRHYVTH